MKTLNHTIGRLTISILLVIGLNAVAQPQFTAIKVADEGAMQLYWQSEPHHLYEVDEADALVDTNTGSITWSKLYDNYPSHGTNTFIGDFGNYNLAPAIVFPKNSPVRFYRVVDKGANTASDEPSVFITSPTSNAAVTGELTVNVMAGSDQPVISWTKLYVDGQEMQMADSTTNWTDGATNYEMATYSINTCEWGNETHTLLATARCASGLGDALNAPPVLLGHAVSPFVPVLFSNLVTRISFSQRFFDPAAGQTQQVSAVFANNSDWTLNIKDVNSNIVLTATGSGTSMLYNWDGTGNGGTNLPTGIYYYYISAETNGQPSDAMSSGGSSSFARSESPELWAVAPDSENVVPLAIYPPGCDTNSLTIFSATPSEAESLTASARPKSGVAMSSGGGFSPDAASGGSSAAFQNSSPAPQKPPNKPVKGVAGQFGLAYQDYFPSGLALATPFNGFPVLPGQKGQHVQLENSSGTTATCPFVESVRIDGFVTQMGRGGWQSGLTEANTQLKAADLQGSGSPFNQFPLGLLSLHGTYATSIDYNANQSKPIYFPIDGRPGASSWVSMAQMKFGASGTNGLKWMVILACNSLRQDNWYSMQNAGITPFNGNLHLLLGANSTCDNGNLVIFAKKMLGLDGRQRESIYDAWNESTPFCATRPVQFAIAGFNDCKQDMLTGDNATTPQGSVFYDPLQIVQ